MICTKPATSQSKSVSRSQMQKTEPKEREFVYGWNFTKLNVNQSQFMTGDMRIELFNSKFTKPPFDPELQTKTNICLDVNIELEPYHDISVENARNNDHYYNLTDNQMLNIIPDDLKQQ